MLTNLKNVRELVAILLFVSCAACHSAGNFGIDLTFDPFAPLALMPGEGADDERIGSIARAAALWNFTAATQLIVHHESLEIVTQDNADELAAEPTDSASLIIRFERAAGNFYGLYRDEVGEVVINSSLRDTTEQAIVIAHELGHAFGLRHVEHNSRPSVMNPGNRAIAPTAADVQELKQLWENPPTDDSAVTVEKP